MKKLTVKNYQKNSLYPKVVKAVGLLLKEKDEIATVDVYLKMGNLLFKDYESWQKGQIPYLERVIQGSLSKAQRILWIIGYYMHDLNMVKIEHPYKAKAGNKGLIFSKSRIKKIETCYSRHYKWNRSQEIKNRIIEESLIASASSLK